MSWSSLGNFRCLFPHFQTSGFPHTEPAMFGRVSPSFHIPASTLAIMPPIRLHDPRRSSERCDRRGKNGGSSGVPGGWCWVVRRKLLFSNDLWRKTGHSVYRTQATELKRLTMNLRKQPPGTPEEPKPNGCEYGNPDPSDSKNSMDPR